MNIFGIGGRLAAITGAYAVLLAVVLRGFGWVCPLPVPKVVATAVGVGLLLIGIPFFVVSVVSLLRGFPTGRLMTSGIYAVCRNPLYSSFICFIVPGLMVLTGSWPFLTVPVVLYAAFRRLIRREEEHLEQTFGATYRAYKAVTPAVLPRLPRFLIDAACRKR